METATATVTLSWQSVIALSSFLAAVFAIVSHYNKAYNFVQRQKQQDEIINNMQEELALLTYGVLACLKGLKEQGCNGPVTEAVNKIEKHLNEKAHGG